MPLQSSFIRNTLLLKDRCLMNLGRENILICQQFPYAFQRQLHKQCTHRCSKNSTCYNLRQNGRNSPIIQQLKKKSRKGWGFPPPSVIAQEEHTFLHFSSILCLLTQESKSPLCPGISNPQIVTYYIIMIVAYMIGRLG